MGNAVVRNRIKRQLREIMRGRLESVPSSNDYVLIVRQGLPEAAEANGREWLEERVDEVPRKGGRVSAVAPLPRDRPDPALPAPDLAAPAGEHLQVPARPAQYAALAIRSAATLKGTPMAAWRLLRCHPSSRRRIDYP